MLARYLIDEFELSAARVRDQIVVSGDTLKTRSDPAIHVTVLRGICAGLRPVGEERISKDAGERVARKLMRVLQFYDPGIVHNRVT